DGTPPQAEARPTDRNKSGGALARVCGRLERRAAARISRHKAEDRLQPVPCPREERLGDAAPARTRPVHYVPCDGVPRGKQSAHLPGVPRVRGAFGRERSATLSPFQRTAAAARRVLARAPRR